MVPESFITYVYLEKRKTLDIITEFQLIYQAQKYNLSFVPKYLNILIGLTVWRAVEGRWTKCTRVVHAPTTSRYGITKTD